MIAFVLSGGGNRGALQVGALQVLLEHGIKPQMIVGTSAGAINAAYLAVMPSAARAARLARVWQTVSGEDIYPGNRLMMLWRVVSHRPSLHPNDQFRDFLERNMGPHVRTFGQITRVALYIVATDLDSGTLRLFGEDPGDSLLDALMASTALPPLHPPWSYRGRSYIDGGAVADLPLRVAVDKGATEIYALHVVGGPGAVPPVRDVIHIARQAVGSLLQQQKAADLEWAMQNPKVRLHHVQLCSPIDVPYWDFSHATEMIAAGRRTMEAYLEQRYAPPMPLRQRMAARLSAWKAALLGTESQRAEALATTASPTGAGPEKSMFIAEEVDEGVGALAGSHASEAENKPEAPHEMAMEHRHRACRRAQGWQHLGEYLRRAFRETRQRRPG